MAANGRPRTIRYVLGLGGLSLAISWLALVGLYPRWMDPYWPQHSDFYIPVGLKNLGFDPFHNRPIGSLLDYLRGYLGVRGSIVIPQVFCALNTFILGLTVPKVTGQSLNKKYLLCFAAYALTVFSHAYYFTFAFEDLYSQAAFTTLACALYIYATRPADRYVGAWFTLLVLISFLTKETFAVSLVILVLFFQPTLADGRKLALKTRGRGCALITLCFGLAFAFNRSVGSPFIAGSDEASAPYRTSLVPSSIAREWFRYFNDGYRDLGWVLLISVLAVAYLNRRQLSNAVVLVAAGGAAWLPNSLLPNHYSPGYSFSGVYLMALPLLFFCPEAGEAGRLRQRRRAVFAALMTAAFSYALFVAPRLNFRRFENQWILKQTLYQKHFYPDLMRLLRTRGLDRPKHVLLTGIHFPFTPLEMLAAIGPELKASNVVLHVVKYGFAHEIAWKPWVNVHYHAPNEARGVAFDEAWMVIETGAITWTSDLNQGVGILPVQPFTQILVPDLQKIRAGEGEPYAVLRLAGAKLRDFNLLAEARACFCAALAMNPKDYNSWYWLSRTQQDLGLGSQMSLRRAIELTPDDKAKSAWMDLDKEENQAGGRPPPDHCP